MGLALILGVVVGQAVQDEDLTPLGALVEGRQQLVDVLGVEVQQVAVGVRLADLRQGGDCIGHNLKDGRCSVTTALREKTLFSLSVTTSVMVATHNNH